ncbi:MAG TPA: PEGA domain-containing protein [Terriglobales bacterium]|nr:PEGA domain-containing protein [Terriglobales bacterium]
MKIRFALLSLILSGSFVWGQDTAPSATCGKNVSFAIAENGQPVPAIPKFTLKWLGSKSRQESFSSLCFSQVPSLNQTNYIVVFSTNPAAFDGLKASAHTYKTAPQAHEANASANSYGGSWSYAYSGSTPPTTTSTLDLRRDDKPKAVEVRAFDQSGRTISQSSLASISSREKLLEKVLSDIVKDSPSPEARKAFASPLSVYYVNCDVEGPPVSPGLVAASTAPPAPTPTPVKTTPPPPKPELDIWSSPAGADVFLDGQYVGQTPYSAEVPLGQHTIDLRKKNYGIWQRKIQANAGKRRIGGNLEPKVLDLQ